MNNKKGFSPLSIQPVHCIWTDISVSKTNNIHAEVMTIRAATEVLVRQDIIPKTVLCTPNTQDNRKSTHKSFRRGLSASSVKMSW